MKRGGRAESVWKATEDTLEKEKYVEVGVMQRKPYREMNKMEEWGKFDQNSCDAKKVCYRGGMNKMDEWGKFDQIVDAKKVCYREMNKMEKWGEFDRYHFPSSCVHHW